VHDRFRVPPAPSPRRSEWGEKESRQARLSRRSRPFENSSFSPWRAFRPIDARIAEGASEDNSNESAKVVLGRVDEFSIDDVFGIPMLNRA
jgi:hypothetical protein